MAMTKQARILSLTLIAVSFLLFLMACSAEEAAISINADTAVTIYREPS